MMRDQQLNGEQNEIKEILKLKECNRDFSGSPVAGTQHPQCRGPEFRPCSGNWIPHFATKDPHATMKIEDPAYHS